MDYFWLSVLDHEKEWDAALYHWLYYSGFVSSLKRLLWNFARLFICVVKSRPSASFFLAIKTGCRYAQPIPARGNGLFVAVQRIQPTCSFVFGDQNAAILQLDDEVGIESVSRGLQPKRSLRLTGDIAYPGYAPDFWRQWQRRRQLLRRFPFGD